MLYKRVMDLYSGVLPEAELVNTGSLSSKEPLRKGLAMAMPFVLDDLTIDNGKAPYFSAGMRVIGEAAISP